MQVNRKMLLSAKIILVWSILTLVFQYLSFVVGAEYDSKNGLAAALWWMTQVVSFPVWCVSEAAGLAGVRLAGAVAYAAIPASMLTLSLLVLTVSHLAIPAGDVNDPA
ncbi:MAG TPA: hypothetical protein VF574_15295 [Allosphingosinicella sp.]|jgi:hypothetical protein